MQPRRPHDSRSRSAQWPNVRPLRPRRTLAAPVLATAFAAVSVTFGSEFLFDVGLHPLAATAGALGIVVAGSLVAAVGADRTAIGRAVEQWSIGRPLVRPSSAAVATVGLSCCLAAAWLVLRPVVLATFPRFGSPAAMFAWALVDLAAVLLYAPLVLLWVATFAVSAAAPESNTVVIPVAVRVAVTVAGAALSGLWQLLLVRKLEHRVARLREAVEGREDPPAPARK